VSAEEQRDGQQERPEQVRAGWVARPPEPYAEGNTAAMRHGAYSERVVGPLASEILAELMQASDTPEYLLRDQSFAAALAAWSRAEAIVYLLTTFITEQGLAKAFAGRGLLIETLRRWETTAANHRRRLGLDPESRARIMRDLSAARFMSGPDPLSVSLDRIAAERAALEAGERGEGA